MSACFHLSLLILPVVMAWCVCVDNDSKYFSGFGSNVRAAELWNCFVMVYVCSLLTDVLMGCLGITNDV